MESQEKEAQSRKQLKYTRNLFRKKLQLSGFLLILELKSFKIRGFQSLALRETADIYILTISRNGDRKIMQSIEITSRTPSRKRKCDQLSQFRRTSTKAITIEKT